MRRAVRLQSLRIFAEQVGRTEAQSSEASRGIASVLSHRLTTSVRGEVGRTVAQLRSADGRREEGLHGQSSETQFAAAGVGCLRISSDKTKLSRSSSMGMAGISPEERRLGRNCANWQLRARTICQAKAGADDVLEDSGTRPQAYRIAENESGFSSIDRLLRAARTRQRVFAPSSRVLIGLFTKVLPPHWSRRLPNDYV